ncbi:MAG: YncE family protein [Candidatus Sericytochromatia bacterium]
MGFALYPDPPRRALAVPLGATVFTPFAALSARVAEFDPPYVQAMFIRVAMLGGTSAPKLLVGAGNGTPVEVSIDPQGVFASPGDTDYVGDVSLSPLGDNVFEILVGLVTVDPTLLWRLGIRNTDVAQRFFTWVVADNKAETAHPWVDPGAADFQLSATIPLPGVLTHIALDSATQTAYVCTFTENGIAVIDVPGRAVVATVPVGQHPEYVALDPEAHTAYVANSKDSTISVIDTTSRAVTATIPDTPLVTTLAVDPAKGMLYAGCGELNAGQIALISTDTHAVVDRVPLAHRPFDLAVDPTAHTVYATDFAANALLAIDPETRVVSALTLSSKRAFGVVVDPVSHMVYVSCRADNAVIVIDPGTQTMTTIPVGQSPALLAIDPGAYTLFAANRGEDTVSEIDTRTGALRAVRVGRPQGVAVDATRHIAVSASDSAAAYVAVIERGPS